MRVFAEEDQFWEYSKTSLRICGTNATWPFECFEESCALNIGFVTGVNLEAIEGGVHVQRGKKRLAGPGSAFLCAASQGDSHCQVASRIQTRTEHASYHRPPLPLNHTTHLLSHPYYIPTLKWPAQHAHKNFLMTQMVLFPLIPYPLRPNQSHPQRNANVHLWFPQRISLLQSSPEMATSQIRTLTKSRRNHPRILRTLLLHIPRAPATTHLILPQHNKFLIFSRCQYLVLYCEHRSYPYGAGLTHRVFLIAYFLSPPIPPAPQLPSAHNRPPNHKVTLSALS